MNKEKRDMVTDMAVNMEEESREICATDGDHSKPKEYAGDKIISHRGPNDGRRYCVRW